MVTALLSLKKAINVLYVIMHRLPIPAKYPGIISSLFFIGRPPFKGIISSLFFIGRPPFKLLSEYNSLI
jgi:hypothetical protein